MQASRATSESRTEWLRRSNNVREMGNITQPNGVKLAKVFAIIIGVTAILVIIGWVFDIGFLKSVSPSWVTMKFQTAAAFLLTAFILYFISEDFEGGTAVAGIVLPLSSFIIATFMLSLLTSALLGIRTGLEDLFVMEAGGTVKTPVPGRPSVPTIVDFILIATSGVVTVFHPDHLKSILAWLGGMIAVIGAVAFIGYLLDVPQLYYNIAGANTAMAFHTAVLFVLFGIGLVLLPRQGEMT